MVVELEGGITTGLAGALVPAVVYVIVTDKYDEVLFRNTQYPLESCAHTIVGRVIVANALFVML